MKIELERKDIQAIAQEVAERLKPLLIQNQDILFDVEGLSKYLKVKAQWVYQKVYEGAIPYHKTGKYLRFQKADIDRWLSENGK